MRVIRYLELRVITVDEKTPPVNRMLDRLYIDYQKVCVYSKMLLRFETMLRWELIRVAIYDKSKRW